MTSEHVSSPRSFARTRDASAMRRLRMAAVGALGALGALVWVGCGPNPDRYYCDDTGCFSCDAYGCSNVTPPSKQACTGNASCPAGSVCTSLGCTLVCVDDNACPKGEVCKAGVCAPPTSSTPEKKECSTKADCGADKACVAGACQTCGGTSGPCPCAGPSDCGDGQQCVAGACTSPQNACKFSSECGDGKLCADGQCLPACGPAGQCAAGNTCDKGVCKPDAAGGCQNDTQCAPSAPKCIAGACYKQCAQDPECGAGNFCDQGVCKVDTRPKPNCTVDDNCVTPGSTVPNKCVGRFCNFTYSSYQYCRTIDTRIGYCANDGVCRSAEEAQPECTTSAQCTGGKVCVDNRCR